MSIAYRESPSGPRPWQGHARTQLLAVVLGVLPLYSSAMIRSLGSDRSISMGGFVIYLAVVSPLALVVALLLLRFLCGERPSDLNLRPGKLSSDLLATLFLAPVALVANAVSTFVLSGLLPDAETDTSVRALFTEVAADPGLMVLFVGPLLALGAASEEVIRVFLLSRLWRVWPSDRAKVAAVALSAALFGLIHTYQGPVHVVSATIFGLLMAVYYLSSGRVLPLVLAHYGSNAVQLIVFAAARSP